MVGQIWQLEVQQVGREQIVTFRGCGFRDFLSVCTQRPALCMPSRLHACHLQLSQAQVSTHKGPPGKRCRCP